MYKRTISNITNDQLSDVDVESNVQQCKKIKLEPTNNNIFNLLSEYESNYYVISNWIDNKGHCDVNIIDDAGYSVLMYMCEYGDSDAVKLLLEYKADVNVKCNYGYSTLECAFKSGFSRVRKCIIEALLEAGADMYMTKDHLLVKAIKCEYSEVVELLIKYGYNVNLKNVDEYMPLDYAFLVGDNDVRNDIFKLLLDNGATLDYTCFNLLIEAIINEYDDLVDLLLKYNFNVNRNNFNNETDLMLDVYEEMEDLIENPINLEEHGQANIALDYAFEIEDGERRYKILAGLLKHGADLKLTKENLLVNSIKMGDVKLTELLLEYGADVNTKDNYRNSPLENVSEYVKDIDVKYNMYKLLFKYGADLSIIRDNLLLESIYSNYENISLLLLENTKNENITFAIFFNAVDSGNCELVEQMLDRGATKYLNDLYHSDSCEALCTPLGIPNDTTMSILLMLYGARIYYRENTEDIPHYKFGKWLNIEDVFPGLAQRAIFVKNRITSWLETYIRFNNKMTNYTKPTKTKAISIILNDFDILTNV